MKITHDEFTKEHTSITKGILVIMLLIHHVFYPGNVEKYGIDTIISDQTVVNKIAVFCNICIAGFTFLSAYGMTISFKKQKSSDSRCLFILSGRRLIKLLFGVIMIYLLAIFYRQFVMHQSIWELYAPDGAKSYLRIFLWMIVDMSGMASYVNTPTINVTWWYLSYAILLILAMPLIYGIYEKYRYFIIPVSCLLPYVILNEKLSFSMLFPVAMLGTAFAYEGWLTDQKLGNKKIVKTAIYFFIFYMAYKISIHMGLFYAYILSFSIPCIVYLFIGRIPVLRDLLRFIGKHATNIFLTHTFIYYYFHADFIYSFRDSWLILIVLLGINIGLAIVVELIKKITGYNLLMNKILDAYDKRWSKYF